MAPVSDRAVLIRLQNIVYARPAPCANSPALSARPRRALLDPATTGPGSTSPPPARAGRAGGARSRPATGHLLDGGAALAARAQRERVRLRLN